MLKNGMLLHPVITAAQPRLTQDETNYYVDLALEAAYHLMEKSMIQGGTVPWTKYTQEGDLKLYLSHDTRGPALFCAVMDMGGLMDDAVQFLEALRNGDKEVIDQPAFREQQCIQSTTIHAIERPRNERIDVIWRAFRCPLGESVVRDMSLLEFGHAFLIDNRMGYVSMSTSITLPYCPPAKSAEYVRATNHGSGYIVIEGDKPGVLHVAYVSHVDLNVQPALRPHVRQAMAKTCSRALRHAEQHLRHRRTWRNQRHLGLVVETVPKGIRRFCHCCSSKFSLTSVKRQCMNCGEVVCSPCFQVSGIRGGSVAKLGLCTSCCDALPPSIELQPVTTERSALAKFFGRGKESGAKPVVESSGHSTMSSQSPGSSMECNVEYTPLTFRLSELADIVATGESRDHRKSAIETSSRQSTAPFRSTRGVEKAAEPKQWGFAPSTVQILMACSR